VRAPVCRRTVNTAGRRASLCRVKLQDRTICDVHGSVPIVQKGTINSDNHRPLTHSVKLRSRLLLIGVDYGLEGNSDLAAYSASLIRASEFRCGHSFISGARPVKKRIIDDLIFYLDTITMLLSPFMASKIKASLCTLAVPDLISEAYRCLRHTILRTDRPIPGMPRNTSYCAFLSITDSNMVDV